jgi:thioredoxin-like negative regulator of GroEL
VVTVSYDPDRITPEELAQVITQDRCVASVKDISSASPPITVPQPIEAPIPEDAPEFFTTAFEEARKSRRAIVLVFKAEWCGVCQRLIRETLQHPDVAQRLSAVQMVEVDLDKSPELGGWYGVSAVPHVVFISQDGIIVDDVRNFEPPDAFLRRLERLVRG